MRIKIYSDKYAIPNIHQIDAFKNANLEIRKACDILIDAGYDLIEIEHFLQSQLNCYMAEKRIRKAIELRKQERTLKELTRLGQEIDET